MSHKNKTLNPEIKKSKSIWLYVVLVVLLTSNIIFLFYSFNLSKKVNLKDSFSLLNPARKLFTQRDMIINLQPLRDALNEIGKNPNISIYFEFLNTGSNISVNKDSDYFPASLIKLPVAMAVVKKIEDGKWTWTNELVLMRSDKDEKFGNLYEKPIGTRFTIEELVYFSLVESDNTAYRILLRNLEPEELDEVHKHLGLEDLFSSDGKINAKKYSILFRSLYNASFLSEENSSKILAIMSKSLFSSYLQKGLPDNVEFSHKIGISEEENVVLDSGLVYLKNRPYLITVMAANQPQEESEAQMKNISEIIFNYISNYSEEE